MCSWICPQCSEGFSADLHLLGILQLSPLPSSSPACQGCRRALSWPLGICPTSPSARVAGRQAGRHMGKCGWVHANSSHFGNRTGLTVGDMSSSSARRLAPDVPVGLHVSVGLLSVWSVTRRPSPVNLAVMMAMRTWLWRARRPGLEPRSAIY